MIRDYIHNLILTLLFGLCISLGFSSSKALAQNGTGEELEVYLSFRHRGFINSVIVTYYENDTFYLPVTEIFRLFEIEANISGLIISGNFSIEQVPYSINFERQVITYGKNNYAITLDDYFLKELDFYLSIDKFIEVFGLDFSVDFNTLSLNLPRDTELPIIAKLLREQQRVVSEYGNANIEYYPLRNNRKYSLLNGGFMDYSLTTYQNANNYAFNINNSVGIQLLGGDLQGSFYSNLSAQSSTFSTTDLRWRYSIFNSSILTDISLGQTNLDGVLANPYTGIRISNEPIQPRRYFDEFEVQGFTFPQSEVELYLNNALVDFQKSDENGYYRFLSTLSYGSSQLNLKIYGPTGQIIQRSSRIQVPFTFVPSGVFNYVINAGRLDNGIIGSIGDVSVLQGTGSYGVNSWITSKVGVEYFQADMLENKPYITGNISARIKDSYIFTLEGVSSSYYRSSISAVYPNSASFGFFLTNYYDQENIYNTSGNSREIIANAYYPFKIFGLPLNVRTSMFSRFRGSNTYTTFRFDVNTRIDKLNITSAFSDRKVDNFNFLKLSSLSVIDSYVTYNFARNPNVPRFIRGTFLRGQISFLPEKNELESVQFQYSKNVFKHGRIQISIGRNFQNEFNSLRFNFIYDFIKTRTNTTITAINNTYNSNQNFRGSIGFDSNYKQLLFSSRDQVGMSATAVRLYVDNNSNNVFDDGDETIEGGNIRVGRTGTSNISKGGILYYTQMLPYFQYNMEMNKGSIPNPMLVPEVDKFSIVTDPNTFKRIDVPFYMSGVMDGVVNRTTLEGLVYGIGGLKLILSSEERNIYKEIRTYSDGSFYDYELPPGNYTLKVDQKQLDFLNVRSEPEVIEFEVKAIAEGDFIEGLNFLLLPSDFEESEAAKQQKITLAEVTDEIKASPEILEFSENTYLTIDQALRFLILAQNAFYSKNLDVAFSFVNQSLELFETAQGYALKGSFYYFEGNREQAQRNWQMALRFNPDLFIPDMDTLNEHVTAGSSDK